MVLNTSLEGYNHWVTPPNETTGKPTILSLIFYSRGRQEEFYSIKYKTGIFLEPSILHIHVFMDYKEHSWYTIKSMLGS